MHFLSFFTYCKKPSKGFTLIEVIISLAIFTILSLSMMNVMDQTSKSQQQVEQWIQKSRIAQNLKSRIYQDIQSGITALDLHFFIYSAYRQYLSDHKSAQWIFNDLDTDSQSFFQREIIFQNFSFRGEKESISFHFFSNHSQLMQIEYSVKDCFLKEDSSKPSKCVVRTSYPLSDSENSTEEPLFENVDKLEFSYFNPKNNDWEEQFTTASTFSVLIFPFPIPPAIEVKIEFSEDQKEPLSFLIPVAQSLLSNHISDPIAFAYTSKYSATSRTNNPRNNQGPENNNSKGPLQNKPRNNQGLENNNSKAPSTPKGPPK